PGEGPARLHCGEPATPGRGGGPGGRRGVMSPAKKTATKKTTTRKTTRRKRGPAEPRGPEARESALDRTDEHVSALTERDEKARGSVLASYRGPAARRPLARASLATASVEPTPLQRELPRYHPERHDGSLG